MECQEIEERKIDEEDGGREEKEERRKKIRLHKYIGETSKSVYERTLEQQMAYNTINQNSFMVKHWLEKHEEEEMERERFGVKVVSYTMSSF